MTAGSQRQREWALKIADAAAEGLDKDGGLWYEQEGGGLVTEKHSAAGGGDGRFPTPGRSARQ